MGKDELNDNILDYFHATLRVSGPTTDPEAITRLVGIEPTESHRVGDLAAIRSPSGPVRRKLGYWGLSTPDDHFENFSARMLELIRRVRPGLLRDDPSSGVLVDVKVGLFGVRDQSTLVIEDEVHRELALRGWPLVFDMYVESQPLP